MNGSSTDRRLLVVGPDDVAAVLRAVADRRDSSASVAGESVAAVVGGGADDTDTSGVEASDEAGEADGRSVSAASDEADAVLVVADDPAGVVERLSETTAPVVVATDEETTAGVDALRAGATATLPRDALAEAPETALDRLLELADTGDDSSVPDSRAASDDGTTSGTETAGQTPNGDGTEMAGQTPNGDGTETAGQTPNGDGTETAGQRLDEAGATTTVTGAGERPLDRRYEVVLDEMTDVVTVHDPETGEMVDANRALCELVGRDREWVLDAGVDGVSATADGYTVDRAVELYQRVVASGEEERVEWKLELPDGERRTLAARLTPVEIDGETLAMAVCRDVTERERRERRLREEREKYSTLVEQSTDGVTVVQDREFVFVNDRFADVTGYDPESLVGEPLESIFAPEYESLVRERYRERIGDGDPPRRYDVEVETPDGDRRVFELAVSAISHEGEPATLANFRDVTDRRAREAELERRERQFQQIAEAVDEVIHLAEPDLSETHYVSPSYEEIWGQDPEQMYEDSFSFAETVHPADRDEFLGLLQDWIDCWTDPDRRGPDSHDYEYRVRRDDGSVRWIEGRVYPIRAADDPREVTRVVSLSRDVTDERERRQTVESFQEATAELTTASTPEAACRTAVEATADVFELDAAVHLLDDETGELAATAAAGSLAPADELPTCGPGDPAWHAFVDEETTRIDLPDGASFPVTDGGGRGDGDGAPGTESDEGEPETGTETGDDGVTTGVATGTTAVLVPLASHGVLCVVGDEGAPSAETANLVAATLEAALNHIAGERRLASQRAELERQTQRAEQLERVAELTRRVEAAITEQSDRVGVERAVCERLAEIEPFAAAWTASTSGGGETGTLAPRVTAGVADETVAQCLADASDADPHPATAASTTGETTTETGFVTAGGAPWRRALVRRGVEAVCAVPLVYEGITHGVLVIEATEADAFDGPAGDAVDQLGASIGYAITAVERRRALESDETVELEFRGDATVPFARLARETGRTVRHERTVRRQDGSLTVVYTLPSGETGSDGPDTGVSATTGDDESDVAAVAERVFPGETTVTAGEDGGVTVEREGTTWFGATVSEYGGVLRRGTARPDGTELVVELPTETDVRRFVDRLGERLPGLSLFARREHEASAASADGVARRLADRLSDRQAEALETAYEMGYFAWPRDHEGREVAAAMDITQPTLNRHLREAERKVFDTLLDGDGGDERDDDE